MIRKPRCYRRSALFCETSMYPHEVVAAAHQPHPPLKRAPLMRSGSGATYQRGQPRPEGGLQTLDVGGVDQRSYRTLGPDHPRDHLCLSAHDHTPEDLHHPSALVALYELGDHHPCGQYQPRTANLASMNRLPENVQSLAGIAGEPIGYQQNPLYGATGAHPDEQTLDQKAVARCWLITEPSHSLLLTSRAEASQ